MARKQEWYTTGGDAWKNLDGAGYQFAMSFTLGTTGNNLTFNVTQVKVFLLDNDAATGNSTWEIQGVQPDGQPDGTALSTGTLDMATVASGSGGWSTITMSSATLQAGQMYVLVCTDGFATGSHLISWRADAGGGYGGGNEWSSTDSGVTWTDDAPVDMLFQIEGGSYDGTLCSLADASNKAGANANAGAKEEVLMSDYVRQAEGTINAVTRFNWVKTYSSLTDDVRFILNDVASDLAAIYAITYDMSGFTDRVEAETMINVYRDAALRGLSILKNQEVKTFMTGDE